MKVIKQTRLQKILKFLFLFTGISLLLLSASPVSANQRGRSCVIRGIVKDSDNTALEFVTVYIKGTTLAVNSNEKGEYMLRVIPGKHVVCAQLMGYASFEKEVDLKPEDRLVIDITLSEEKFELGEVEVVAKSLVQQINETAYNVVAIDAKALHNTSLDLAHALDRISGVKIKEVGGVGSDTQISLNGFSGRHVKVFMDGIPMEGSGSSFQINNIPINMAERIEVYKGVVPIELGSDALGGAINIVTKNTGNTYVDASYTYGSFNTHKSNLAVGHTTKDGYTFQLNAYQNYSDNNYKVKTNLLDLNTNVFSDEEYWFKRFHDTYHNEAIIAKVGVRDKKWATRMMLEMTWSQEHAEIQNSNLMRIVYGGKERSAKSLIPALTYEKKNLFTDNLNFSLMGRYNKVIANSTDTLARQYNWAGEYREKTSRGESSYTLSENINNSGYLTANVNYKVLEKHYITINNVFNTFSRKASDAVANSETTTDATFMKRTTNKNVLGLAYKFHPSAQWNFSAFGKHYNVHVTGPVDVSTGNTSSYELQNKKYSTTGYGLAATYLITDAVQLKASFEKSYRLPTVNELFGDDVLETGDAGLKPESSRNINVNLSYDNVFQQLHAVYFDMGFVYRDTRDYIRRQIEQRYGGAFYTNHGQVRNLGIDMEARYFYGKKFGVGGNFTWQNLVNMERYQSGGVKESVTYKDRMPNVPYLFSNADATYNIHDLFGKGNIFSVGYNLQYVHQFFRSWESEGGNNIFIPTQLSHDITFNYSVRNGRYNVALEAKNFTNEMLFDNYSLQKPGRSFYLKVRYYFYKSR
ncbi:MAG: TonB-dependent receptor [Tannerellaceae bacterium]|nr:TonB-dependent receptor [Tannerellaceae bacterium]